MKLLKDILYRARIEEVIGSTNVAVEHIAFDSRVVSSFCVFVAVPGTLTDGHKFINTALDAGASAVVCEKMPDEMRSGITYIRVKNSAEALGYMAANLYDHPSKEIKLVGVTGTNGKTSVVTLLHQLFTSLGHKAGMLSTVINMVGKEKLNATHTTPDALSINSLLRKIADSGCTYCFMEVSSHAIEQHRITGLRFDAAIFTNISHDHLDYHKSFDNYIAAKKKLFDNLGKDSYAIFNKDDRHGSVIVQNTYAKKRSTALKTVADFKGKVIENDFSGLQLNINGHDVWTKLVGKFNAYNLLNVYAAASLFEQDNLRILTILSSLKPPEGRFQHIKTLEGINGVVDYAHTPDALDNVLKTISEIRGGNEKVICIVGCGGDRDKAKRPKMAKIAAKYSDRVILTSDNPRSEDPEAIIKDMKAGLDPTGKKKVTAITNREEAIKTACAFAAPGDIILVAGKGHETYQEIKGERKHFDDMEVLTEALKNR